MAAAGPSAISAAEQPLNPKAITIKLPDQIQWKRNAAGTNEVAVFYGDPDKPGLYVQLFKWLPGNMSRPHWHPNDRVITVIKGTWWVGTGDKFDPDSTVPIPDRQLRDPFRQGNPLRRRQGRRSLVADRRRRAGNRDAGIDPAACPLGDCPGLERAAPALALMHGRVRAYRRR